MQVKRFFAADMRQAMKLVRDELGADAAIIGNRRIAGGVELTAALDYTPQALAPRVRVFYSAKSRTQLLQVDIDLAASEGRERILGIESPEKWGFRELEKLWLP